MHLLKPIFIFSFLYFFSVFSYTTSVGTLYKSLDPKSVAKQLAFYELYPQTEEGKKALKRAFFLLKEKEQKALALPKLDFSFLIKAVNNLEPASELELTEKELLFIEKLSAGLQNRQLKTFGCSKEEDFFKAEAKEIDLSRALLIAQLGETEKALKKIRLYEAALDLMALQIRAKLPEQAADLEKIKAISDFIFFEMGFAFPPHSTYAEQIDSFTYLPSVIDTKKGVCLGTSILYFSLAQRLGLPLEIVTPPGHIFLRYEQPKEPVNIETTMRGVHIPDEKYLGIELKRLIKRNVKEMVGFSFINAASVFLKKKEFEKALQLYERAIKYLPDDPLAQELLGFCCIFAKKEKEGRAYLQKASEGADNYHFSSHSLIEDFLKQKVNAEGIMEFFVPFDDSRTILESKKERLENILKKHPEFKSGILLIASIYAEMGRQKEAYNMLVEYHRLEPADPVIAFYLSQIAFRRKDMPAAWHYFSKARSNFQKQGPEPGIIKHFYFSLKKAALE